MVPLKFCQCCVCCSGNAADAVLNATVDYDAVLSTGNAVDAVPTLMLTMTLSSGTAAEAVLDVAVDDGAVLSSGNAAQGITVVFG